MERLRVIALIAFAVGVATYGVLLRFGVAPRIVHRQMVYVWAAGRRIDAGGFAVDFRQCGTNTHCFGFIDQVRGNGRWTKGASYDGRVIDLWQWPQRQYCSEWSLESSRIERRFLVRCSEWIPAGQL
jgi:hypothetical protein